MKNLNILSKIQEEGPKVIDQFGLTLDINKKGFRVFINSFIVKQGNKKFQPTLKDALVITLTGYVEVMRRIQSDALEFGNDAEIKYKEAGDFIENIINEIV